MTTRPTQPADSRHTMADDERYSHDDRGTRYVRSAHGPVVQQTPMMQRPSEPRFDPRAWRTAQSQPASNAPGTTTRQPAFQAEDDRSAPIAPAQRKVPQVAASLSQPIYTSAPRAPETFSAEQGVPGDVHAPHIAAQALADTGAAVPNRRTHYIAVWAVIGSMSAAYLAGMAWQRSSNFNVAVAPIASAIDRIKSEIAELRQTTLAIDARERQTAARLASTETRIGGISETAAAMTAASAPALPQQQATQQQSAVNGQRPVNRVALASETVAVSAEQAPRQVRTQVMPGVSLAQPGTPGVVIGAAPSMVPADVRADGRGTAPVATKNSPADTPAVSSGVRTGSLNNPVPRKLSGLLVGSGTSMEAVRQSWDQLAQNHGGAMGATEARIAPSPDGSTFQLIAGPYSNDFEAAKACSNLRSRGVTCRPVEFSGSPL